MPSTLDPVILRKLEAFGRRWRNLILLRGACEGVITLLGTMTLVSLVDWLLIVPDAVRWTFSGAGYLATAIVVWLNCVRLLLRAPGPRELARLMEKAEPELREDLIAAVELADSTAEARYDSEVFRRLLQQNVASRVYDIEVDRLLPNKLISRWLYSATIVLMICAGLLLLPGFHFDQLLARAFAPMANVDRVSSVQITIVQPAPADLLVPRGDNVPVVVQISGPEPSKVLLETFREGQKTEKDRVMMSLVGDRQYSAVISAGAETVNYRIRAGDGITRKYTIQTRSRPHVVQFDKTFEYPAYARLSPRQVKEENGDLTALEGSSVHLRLQVDQPVNDAELRITEAGKTTVVKLAPAGTNQLQGSVPITKAGTYLVHLVAAQTGFENKFSPQYEIRPVPDLVPRVSIDSPAKDLIISGDELLPLKGSAKDDLAITNVTQMIRVNESAWTEVPLFTNVNPEASITRQWDLLALKANPGDRVTTKLVARDLKGNRGESAPLHLQIISPGVDAKALRALEAKKRFNDSLKKLRDSAEELKQALSKNETKNLSQGDDLHRKQSVLGANAAVEETARQLDQTLDQLKEALPQAAPGRDAADLALVGEMLSELKQKTLQEARTEIDKISYEPMAAKPAPNLNDATKSASRVADNAGLIAQAYGELFAADQAGTIVGNLNYLEQEQDRMNKQAASEASQGTLGWERLARRQGGAAKETKVVEDMLGALTQQVDRSQANRAKKAQQDLAAARAPLEQALTNSPAGRELLKPAANMEKGVENARAGVLPLERELSQRAERARERLSKIAGPANAKLAELRRDVEELARNQSKLAEPNQKGRRPDQLAAKTAELKEKTAAEWKATVEQLKDRAALEELRRDADSHFVADATKAAQALSALRATAEGQEQAKQAVEPLKNLENAFRTLEAGHTLNEMNSGLKQLANQERWEAQAMDAAVTRPKEWNWLGKRLQSAPQELQKAGLPKDAAQTVAEAARSPVAQAVKQEMDIRQAVQQAANSQRTMVPVPDQLEALNAAMRQAQAMAQPVIDDARAALAQAAPQLSQMMAGLARASGEMEKSTRQAMPSAAQPAAQTAPPAQSTNAAPGNSPVQPASSPATPTENQPASAASPAEPRKLLAQQRDLNQQVNELKDALRRDANVQDITNADGRDRSRDADDAVAMLREPPPKAEDALREATAARQPANQERALSAAAQQQQKMAEVLNQLAKHYQELEAGRAPETRAALRRAEEEMGIKSGLDSEYTKAETLASMMQKTPEQMLRELEQELARNEVMRKELDNIADNTLDKARNQLQRSASQEQSIGQKLNEAVKAQERKPSMAEKARQIAEDARKMAKQTVPDIRMDASASQSGAQPELDRATEALQSAADKAPADFTKPMTELARQMSELAKPLQQAGSDLNAAAQKAAEALKKLSPSDAKAAAAHSAQTQADKAAKKSEEMRREAQQMADQLAAMAKSSDSQMAQAAAQQGPIAQNVADAGSDIGRAGRHESRLGTPQGMALQQVGSDTQAVSEKQVPAAQQALASSQSPATAAGAVDNARQAVEQQLAGLKAALAMEANKSASSGSPNASQANQNGQPAEGNPSSSQASPNSQLSPGESKQMARTLDRIDAAMNAAAGKTQQSQAGNDPNQNASNAMADAAQAQQAAMRSSRQGGNVPGEKPSSESQGTGAGAAMKSDELAVGGLPELRNLNNADWAKLPPKLAQGLMEAQRENMASEYRAMVETYFRVIAEKAKEKRP